MTNRQYWITTKTPESRELFERVKVATRLPSTLSTYDLEDAAPMQSAFETLIGKAVGVAFTLIAPFC